jgi:hypothetical protein
MVAYRQIDAWADEADLTDDIRRALKTCYKRVDDAKAFDGTSQDAIIAGSHLYCLWSFPNSTYLHRGI